MSIILIDEKTFLSKKSFFFLHSSQSQEHFAHIGSLATNTETFILSTKSSKNVNIKYILVYKKCQTQKTLFWNQNIE